MVVIDEEKLDEMVRRAVKEEMESILSSAGKVMDYIIGVAAKSGREVLSLERESTPKKKDAMPPEKEQTVHKRQVEPTIKSRYLHSMSELAELLGCSVQTAQRIKNSGRIPFKQIGRTIIFDSEEVLKALDHKMRKT